MNKDCICPYCCHKFHPNEADFRLSGATGAAKKKSAQAGKKLDKNLIRYNRDLLGISESEAKKLSMQFPAVTLADCEYTESGFKDNFVQRVTYTDTSGNKHISDKRLCPNCHNSLPTGYGLRQTVLISILGDARSGKSVFLTMLIDELEKNQDMASKLTFIGDMRVREKFDEEYRQPLLKEHTLISSTKRKKLPPFAFNFWYQYKDEAGVLKENTIDIIFYDIAGEDLRDDSAIKRNGFNIKDSSGLIFLADPTNFTKLADLFRFSDSALIDAIPAQNSNQGIFSSMYNYFLGAEVERSSIPFALVLSKTDLFKYINFNFFTNRPENRILNILPGEEHKGALNMRTIRGLNVEVKELLCELGEESLINNSAGCFRNAGFFAMSSLGKKPVVEQKSDPETNATIEKGILDGPPEPFRVKEAFYWLLMKNGLLLKYENSQYHSDGCVPAKAKEPWWGKLLAMFKIKPPTPNKPYSYRPT